MGGRVREIFYIGDGDDPQTFLRGLIVRTESHPRIEVLKNSQVTEHEGSPGNFRTTVDNGSTKKVIEHGATIIATGGKEYRGKAYHWVRIQE